MAAEHPEWPVQRRPGQLWASEEALDETIQAGPTHGRENVMVDLSWALLPREIVKAAAPWRQTAQVAAAPPLELRAPTLTRVVRLAEEPP